MRQRHEGMSGLSEHIRRPVVEAPSVEHCSFDPFVLPGVAREELAQHFPVEFLGRVSGPRNDARVIENGRWAMLIGQ
jgi:hypothetical protein